MEEAAGRPLGALCPGGPGTPLVQPPVTVTEPTRPSSPGPPPPSPSLLFPPQQHPSQTSGPATLCLRHCLPGAPGAQPDSPQSTAPDRKCPPRASPSSRLDEGQGHHSCSSSSTRSRRVRTRPGLSPSGAAARPLPPGGRAAPSPPRRRPRAACLAAEAPPSARLPANPAPRSLPHPTPPLPRLAGLAPLAPFPGPFLISGASGRRGCCFSGRSRWPRALLRRPCLSRDAWLAPAALTAAWPTRPSGPRRDLPGDLWTLYGRRLSRVLCPALCAAQASRPRTLRCGDAGAARGRPGAVCLTRRASSAGGAPEARSPGRGALAVCVVPGTVHGCGPARVWTLP